MPTPAGAAAWNTQDEPPTFVAHVACWLREGWISQARWIAASRSANTASRLSNATSELTQRTLSRWVEGGRCTVSYPRTRSPNATTKLWLQEDLDCSVLFLLKHLVGLRRLVQWQGVCGETFHAEWVTVGE